MPIKKPVNQNVVKAGGKYVIPKKRRVIKKIQINNGILTAEVSNDADLKKPSKIYWFKNGKYMTPYTRERYKLHHNPTGLDLELNDLTRPWIKEDDLRMVSSPKTPNTSYIRNKAEYYSKLAGDQSYDQQIRFDENTRWITLRTKKKNGEVGTTNLADIPESMLDSVAVNAGRSDTDFWTDLALVGKEEMFGNYSDLLHHNRPKAGGIVPAGLVNNHAFNLSPYSDYYAAMGNLFPSMDLGTLQEVANMERNAKHAIENGLIVEQTPRYSNYLLADAFKRYAVNPYKYNPGQKNHVPMLNGIRYELSGEKQLQDYWNTRGQYEYARGSKEGISKPVFDNIDFDTGKVPEARLLYRDPNYDMNRAVQLGYGAGEDGHYPSRDYVTGDILKYPSHPTFGKALYADMGEGYLPVKRKKGKLKANTQPTPMRQWMDNTFKQPVIPFK